ncbi:DUF992 domain-containing protein [Chelatococcus sp. SYSU_G07232]|uniref:DUF992 domain-containing protein n=1 Tax=Chelatococcus albus TaxID=3047466 RepID=A0ABT7AIQ0_9HYPH|nr:DUF992 domain-containing protein [Chelatococcus sp. SYSU_G07232]MDJ1159244.1 DUF992 domain-containing protein [Chelatococcus sp. SYSU_G07232]
MPASGTKAVAAALLVGSMHLGRQHPTLRTRAAVTRLRQAERAGESVRAAAEGRPDPRPDKGVGAMIEPRALLYGGIAASVVLLAPAVGAQAQPARTQDTTQVGTLTCNISGGPGFIITSSKALDCQFRDRKGTRDFYVGTIRKFGLDIGATAKGRMVWAVFAPSKAIGRGALAGEYVGAAGEATVVGGVGANVLLGGSQNTFSLQPISVQGQTGLNLAVDVASMQLEPAVAQRSRRIIIEERRY